MDASLITEKGETSGTFTVSSDGIRFVAISMLTNKLIFQHSWSEVLEVEIDGADELQKRVTRMFLVGLFAFALKKRRPVRSTPTSTLRLTTTFFASRRSPRLKSARYSALSETDSAR